MRDWVLWFDAEGPDGLVNGKAPGVCVAKTKSGRIGDEVRPGRRVISPLQLAERRENAAHPCSTTYES
jgi:hypothetical protein